MIFKTIKNLIRRGVPAKSSLDYVQDLRGLVVEEEGFGVRSVSAQWKSKLPGFTYGAFRNLGAWQFPVDKKVKRIRFRLMAAKPEVFHFNHIRFLKKGENGALSQITSGHICRMSSVANVLPDPYLAMTGGGGNSVSAHSKKELNPWWEIEFDDAQHVMAVELYNRKDLMGYRASSLVLSAFDEEGKCVIKWGRSQKAARDTLFLREIIPTLKNIATTLQACGHDQLSLDLTRSFSAYIIAENDKELIASLKSECLQYIQAACVALRHVTPDIAVDKDTPTSIALKGHQGKHLRILAFGRPRPTPPTLNVSVAGNIHHLEENKNHSLEAQILRKKRQTWCLPPAHVFELDTADLLEVEAINIWAGNDECADVFVLREIQTSENGKDWTTIDTTLPEMKVQMQALTLYEWVVGDKWDAEFIYEVGYFQATYRMHRARAFKPLLGGKRGLPRKVGLKFFMAGITDGGLTATYLPSVIYTRHGLSVPFSQKNADHLCERMHAFSQFIEDSFGLKIFPCYGTLLGIYRDGMFLPHDDDIDMACVVDLPEGKTPREATEDWCERIKALGVDCEPPTPMSLNLHVYFEGEDMDLFFTYRQKPKDKNLLGHMVAYKVMDIKTALVEPVSTLEFMGRTFYAPAKIEAFLEARYGKTWHVPDPTFEL